MTLATCRPRAESITGANVLGFGMGPTGISYTGLEELNLFEGSGGNLTVVKSTSTTTMVTTGSGARHDRCLEQQRYACGHHGCIVNRR